MGCPKGQKLIKNLVLKSLKNYFWEIFSAYSYHHFIFMMKFLSFF